MAVSANRLPATVSILDLATDADWIGLHEEIDPSLANPSEIEVLEDLIVAAFNDARAKVSAHAEGEMQKLTGGLALPGGFKLPF